MGGREAQHQFISLGLWAIVVRSSCFYSSPVILLSKLFHTLAVMSICFIGFGWKRSLLLDRSITPQDNTIHGVSSQRTGRRTTLPVIRDGYVPFQRPSQRKQGIYRAQKLLNISTRVISGRRKWYHIHDVPRDTQWLGFRHLVRYQWLCKVSSGITMGRPEPKRTEPPHVAPYILNEARRRRLCYDTARDYSLRSTAHCSLFPGSTRGFRRHQPRCFPRVQNDCV